MTVAMVLAIVVAVPIGIAVMAMWSVVLGAPAVSVMAPWWWLRRVVGRR